MNQEEIKMSKHGGFREGSGRPLGASSKATQEAKARISDIAKEYSQDAIETLVDVMRNGSSDNARIAAATAILDRGYGKPSKEINTNIPTVNAPTKIQLVPFEG